ncbi:MAG: GNAT family N-acetyltransferase [Burkholderiaceae bacterium]
MSRDYRTQLCADIASIGRDDWNALLAGDTAANPFVRHEYLHALEASGCVGQRSGWTPLHLTLWRGDRLAAAVPLYVKSHSFGEYVFDWAWADAYARHGLAYYPKLVAAVPFAPVAGTRLLATDDDARDALADALLAHARAGGVSSLHVLFAPAAQIERLATRGMLVRRGVQFHWRNAGFASFDQFLAALAQPKRKKIRAERRQVAQAGVALERRTGDEITAAEWDFFHRCYRATYAAHGSTPYLNRDFFHRLGEAMPQHLLLVIARRDGRPIAAALGIFDDTRLYGRHWGAVEHVSCLHFECCYYQMIEFAIERKLAVFEGGAQGAHKLARGLDPVATASAHWLAEPAMHAAVARFLARESDAVEDTLDELNEHRAWRRLDAAAKD